MRFRETSSEILGTQYWHSSFCCLRWDLCGSTLTGSGSRIKWRISNK